MNSKMERDFPILTLDSLQEGENIMTNENDKIDKVADDHSSGTEHTRGGCCYRPNVDILEKDDELVVLADMPGTKGSKIDIRFDAGTLDIHAEVEPRQYEDTEYLLHEYGVGNYCRRFRISEAIDASKIVAEYTDGVLTLHLPKSEAVKPRKITVGA